MVDFKHHHEECERLSNKNKKADPIEPPEHYNMDSETPMKITPIDERLWKALSHVCGYAQHQAKCLTDADWKYAEGLPESIALLSEFVGCFEADGKVSQRGALPRAWNKKTIFGSDTKYKVPPTEEASAVQKDANAKKLLEELT